MALEAVGAKMSLIINCPMCRNVVVGNTPHKCPKQGGKEYRREDLQQIAAGAMNEDGTYKPWKAAQTVANLKNLMAPPYKLQLYAPSGTLVEGMGQQEFLAQFRQFRPEIQAQEHQTLTEMLETARIVLGKGDWLFAITGTVQGRSKPIGFVDTPILEKAITYHESQGHEGLI